MAAAVGRLAASPALCRAAAVHPARACQWLNPTPAAGVVTAVGSSTTAPHQRLSTAAPRKDVASMSDEEKLQCIASGTAPACGTRYVELSAAVFGGAVPVQPGEPGTRTGRKILRAPLKGPALLDWYAPTGASYKDNPFRLTEKQVRWKAKLDALRKYGKGPPKKKKS
ncbi:hypothetical protein BU14_0536s0007 [Porphyra umbilicalis]|uniref:Uncharacterized protein n=1 Tax=Porphyra umbilicalis TaxID=2786 RepID=A0A1X6NSB9_PORUM|nr:hypothetical protein BU14_0536s0007 [Porphyra umbilicalis]|eukprot:OSX71420.1 hypothetical protein BU14_0536s0007 [Porphyra umbilicalis]